MSYEDSDSLLVRVRAAFGADVTADPGTWSWMDITQWWYAPDDVTITWGRSPRAEQAESSSLTLTLQNTDGRFTSENAMSPYWPDVVPWTPITFDIDLGDGSGWRNKFSGFVRSWPVTWPGRSSRMALAKITAVGVLGRIGRGSPPQLSPMRRTNTSTTNRIGLLAYWPLEDEADAEQAVSEVDGVGPMAVVGDVEFAASEVFLSRGETRRYGTRPVPDLEPGGALFGTVPAGTSAGPVEWAVETLWYGGQGDDDDVVLMRWHTLPGGAYVRWDLVQDRAAVDGTYLVAYNAAGAATVVWSAATTFAGPAELVIAAEQSGGNISISVKFGSYSSSASVAGTLTNCAGQIGLNPDGHVFTAGQGFALGHLRVWDRADITPASLVAVNAHLTEVATDRIARQAAEDGLTCTVVTAADPVDTVMGAQPDGTAMDLYQEVEATDGGLLGEEGFGLRYLPRAARYNPDVALTIDGDLRQLGGDLDPVADDNGLRNVVTVDREGGSSATATDPASVAAAGVVPRTVRVNTLTDDVLPDHAGWWLHRSRRWGLRYPSLSINLHTSRSLAADWCSCRPGSRVQAVNPPDQAPGTIDQVIVGASEVFRGRRSWRVSMNVEPAAPWLVAEADGGQRAPADGSTLAADIDADDLTLSLASTAANGVWVTGTTGTNPTDFPVDLRVGGERVTCTGISSSTSPQTVTLSARAVNGVSRSWPAGTSVDAWDSAIAAL